MATKREELALAADGKGCLGRSADDEPVFILCARDKHAASLVREWADRVEREATATAELTLQRKQKIAEARQLARRMDAWQTKKLPD